MATFTTIDTLIIVCCHAIWIGEPESKDFGEENVEDGWLIEFFQKGETPTFVQHIQAGLDTLLSNPSAILVFSGGQTKPQRTKLTEAGTYYDYVVANMAPVFHENVDLDRLYTEGSATDSFQNVLFSLVCYPNFVQQTYEHRHAMAGITDPQWPVPASPHKLIVIGHEFKKARFEELHLPALRYPTQPSRFQYIGIDPKFDEQKMREIRDGDAKRGYGAWKDDLYGKGSLLAGKRVARGWTHKEIQNLTDFWRKKLQDASIHEKPMSQFEKVIAFVEGTEENFPATTPWS